MHTYRQARTHARTHNRTHTHTTAHTHTHTHQLLEPSYLHFSTVGGNFLLTDELIWSLLSHHLNLKHTELILITEWTSKQVYTVHFHVFAYKGTTFLLLLLLLL